MGSNKFYVILCVAFVSQTACSLKDVTEDPECKTNTSSWSGNPNYVFDATSFACETNPINSPFKIDVNSFTTPSVSGHGITSTSDVHSAFDLGRAFWNSASSGANVTIDHNSATDTVSPGLYIAGSGNNVLMMDDYERLKVAPAKTTGWYDSSAPENGYTDCDMIIYSQIGVGGSVAYNEWSIGGSPSTSELSLDHIFGHELGHCLGLNDNTISDSMMEGSVDEGETPTLNSDDNQALVFLYGT